MSSMAELFDVFFNGRKASLSATEPKRRTGIVGTHSFLIKTVSRVEPEMTVGVETDTGSIVIQYPGIEDVRLSPKNSRILAMDILNATQSAKGVDDG
jgi:hypothetical protein